ncbi:MAG: phosphoribosylformylglycinamidine synthase subunit PurQ [Planctomycetaceae bacterium]
MPTPSVCVLRAPGTNCDVETAWAFDTAGAKAERVHLFRLIERPELLDEHQVLCIPGGFSYGDDIGAGVIFSRELRGRLGDAVGRFLQADKLVLGICNGFQVLLKSGILPGGGASWPPGDPLPATLTWNLNGRYTAVWVRLAIESGNNPFLRGLEDIELPVAHAEGRIAVSSPRVLADWESRGQIVMRYKARFKPRGKYDQPTPAFTFDDFRKQLRLVRQMQPMQEIIKMIPGMAENVAAMDPEKDLQRVETMIDAMTPEERDHPETIHATACARIASASRTAPSDVEKLLQNFRAMQGMLQSMSKVGLLNRMGGRDHAPPENLLPFPDNPNGSIANVAGLSDPSGRVLGLMPHPERFLHATQHPQWTRKKLTGEGTGMRIFRNAVEYFG